MVFRVSLVVLAATGVVAGVGCRSKEAAKNSPAPAVASAVAEPKVVSDAAVARALNPSGEKPYSGPIGTLSGIVHASGDPPPDQPEVVARVPAHKCDDARAFYAKLFREGPNRELGDVLVAVTGYAGYLSPREDTKNIFIRGCSFESRTVAAVFGQTINVYNKGGETFIPELVGAPTGAFLVAVPGGDPVKLFPDHVGQYAIVDKSHRYAHVDVFVLKYPTVAVTGIDGKFSISGIPAGEVVVSALLPATGQTAQQRVVIGAGETATADFVLPYSAGAGVPQKASAP